MTGAQQVEHTSTSTGKMWKQTFRRSYVEQAFRRVSVRESLQHGSENAPYLQRADACRTDVGKANTYKKFKADALNSLNHPAALRRAELAYAVAPLRPQQTVELFSAGHASPTHSVNIQYESAARFFECAGVLNPKNLSLATTS